MSTIVSTQKLVASENIISLIKKEYDSIIVFDNATFPQASHDYSVYKKEPIVYKGRIESNSQRNEERPYGNVFKLLEKKVSTNQKICTTKTFSIQAVNQLISGVSLVSHKSKRVKNNLGHINTLLNNDERMLCDYFGWDKGFDDDNNPMATIVQKVCVGDNSSLKEHGYPHFLVKRHSDMSNPIYYRYSTRMTGYVNKSTGEKEVWMTFYSPEANTKYMGIDYIVFTCGDIRVIVDSKKLYWLMGNRPYLFMFDERAWHMKLQDLCCASVYNSNGTFVGSPVVDIIRINGFNTYQVLDDKCHVIEIVVKNGRQYFFKNFDISQRPTTDQSIRLIVYKFDNNVSCFEECRIGEFLSLTRFAYCIEKNTDIDNYKRLYESIAQKRKRNMIVFNEWMCNNTLPRQLPYLMTKEQGIEKYYLIFDCIEDGIRKGKMEDYIEAVITQVQNRRRHE